MDASFIQPFHEETDDWLLLSLIPGVSSRTLFQLIDVYSDPKAILSMLQSSEWRNLPLHGIAKKWLAEHSGNIRQGVASKVAEVQRWREQGGTVLCWKDDCYPQALREIYDPPIILYAVGDIRYLSSERAIAMVGSRKATRYGIDVAQQFGFELVQAGWNVISGLALGIDGAAHQGALNALQQHNGNELKTGASTVAVVATGLDQVYPASHRGLHQQLVHHGCIISEYPLGTLPRPNYFPRRNRIITGLSKGVLVVEASLKSGSLVSAKCALEQNREVFAVPGMLNNPQAQGCHSLIQQGAKLVTHVEDIIDELNFYQRPNSIIARPSAQVSSLTTQNTLFTDSVESSGIERKEIMPPLQEQKAQDSSDPILNALGVSISTADELIHRTGLSWAELSQKLLTLELSGKIASTQGGYIRTESV